MLELERSRNRWWQKPLALFDGRELPAELVVLRLQLADGEEGAWLNSRGVESGTIDLVRDPAGKFKSLRTSLPSFVQDKLKKLYATTGLSKGAPDLVIWNANTEAVRFVEVKCPHWDRPSVEQLQFHQAAQGADCRVEIIEWEFADAPAA